MNRRKPKRYESEPISPSALERFWAKVQRGGDDECWLWTGATRSGYGAFRANEQLVAAHNFSYFLHKGLHTTPHMDHLCRVRRCVNPQHLEPVQVIENIRRSPITNAGKTHCIHGHSLSGWNMYHIHRKNGVLERRCRTCFYRRHNEHRRKKREAHRDQADHVQMSVM